MEKITTTIEVEAEFSVATDDDGIHFAEVSNVFIAGTDDSIFKLLEGNEIDRLAVECNVEMAARERKGW